VERKAKIEAEDQLWHASKDNEIKLLQLGEAEKLKQELSSLNTLNRTWSPGCWSSHVPPAPNSRS